MAALLPSQTSIWAYGYIDSDDNNQVLSANLIETVEEIRQRVRCIFQQFNEVLAQLDLLSLEDLIKSVHPQILAVPTGNSHEQSEEQAEIEKLFDICVYFIHTDELCAKSAFNVKKEGLFSKGHFSICRGCKNLPKNWEKEKQQYSSLTNVAMLCHELSHDFFQLFWWSFNPPMCTVVLENGVQAFHLHAEGEAGALQEHFCDLIGITCRQLLLSDPEGKLWEPWALPYFEKESGNPAAAHPETSEETANLPTLLRAFDHNRVEQPSPHTMSEWKNIMEPSPTIDSGGIHIGCCILNKVFHTFFCAVCGDLGLSPVLSTSPQITERNRNPLHLWVKALSICMKEAEKKSFCFVTFAEKTLSEVTKEHFPDNHEVFHRYLNDAWIQAGVLEGSPSKQGQVEPEGACSF